MGRLLQVDRSPLNLTLLLVLEAAFYWFFCWAQYYFSPADQVRYLNVVLGVSMLILAVAWLLKRGLLSIVAIQLAAHLAGYLYYQNWDSLRDKIAIDFQFPLFLPTFYVLPPLLIFLLRRRITKEPVNWL